MLITLSGNQKSGFLSFFFCFYLNFFHRFVSQVLLFIFGDPLWVSFYRIFFASYLAYFVGSGSSKTQNMLNFSERSIGVWISMFPRKFWKTSWIFFSFNFPLAAPRPTLGHYYWGSSLTHPMSITAFLKFTSEGHLEPCSEVVSQSPVEGLVGFELGTFQF